MTKIFPDDIPIRAGGGTQRQPFARFVNKEWQIKTEGPNDERKIEGSYTVLCADGSVYRRTLDHDGYIIHEILVRKGKGKSNV